MRTIEVKTAAERLNELLRDPDAYFAQVHAEARAVAAAQDGCSRRWWRGLLRRR